MRIRISETRKSGGNQPPSYPKFLGAARCKNRGYRQLICGIGGKKPGRVLMSWERPFEGLNTVPHPLLRVLPCLTNSYLLSSSCGQHYQVLEDLQLPRLLFFFASPQRPFLRNNSVSHLYFRKKKKNTPYYGMTN